MAQRTVCLFDNDLDGFTAAWAVWKAFPATEFIVASYDTPLPDIHDARVILVDFCGDLDGMLRLVENNTQVTVIDHHATQKDTLKELTARFGQTGRFSASYDVDHSAAWLAWNYFHGDTPTPNLVLYVEDRDLWKWRLDNTRAFTEGLEQVRRTFSTWEKACDPTHEEELMVLGRAAYEALLQKCEQALADTCIKVEFEGFSDVPCAQGHREINSDMTNLMLERYEAKIAIAWQLKEEDNGVFSIRLTSAPDGPDVGAIAQKLGGGGHYHAAGCRVDPDHPLAMQISNAQNAPEDTSDTSEDV